MAFNNKSRLPDTPWHVGYAYKDEHDPRRHKAWCIHLDNGKCKCGFSGCYMTTCAGSSHCKYYAEGEAQWEQYLEEMKTEEEKAEEAAEVRAALYRKEKRDYVRAQLESGTYLSRFRFFPSMINCPFCRDKMKDLQCKYCLAKFKVVTTITEESIKNAAEEGFFLVKKV